MDNLKDSKSMVIGSFRISYVDFATILKYLTDTGNNLNSPGNVLKTLAMLAAETIREDNPTIKFTREEAKKFILAYNEKRNTLSRLKIKGKTLTSIEEDFSTDDLINPAETLDDEPNWDEL